MIVPPCQHPLPVRVSRITKPRVRWMRTAGTAPSFHNIPHHPLAQGWGWNPLTISVCWSGTARVNMATHCPFIFSFGCVIPMFGVLWPWCAFGVRVAGPCWSHVSLVVSWLVSWWCNLCLCVFSIHKQRAAQNTVYSYNKLNQGSHSKVEIISLTSFQLE